MNHEARDVQYNIKLGDGIKLIFFSVSDDVNKNREKKHAFKGMFSLNIGNINLERRRSNWTRLPNELLLDTNRQDHVRAVAV